MEREKKEDRLAELFFKELWYDGNISSNILPPPN